MKMGPIHLFTLGRGRHVEATQTAVEDPLGWDFEIIPDRKVWHLEGMVNEALRGSTALEMAPSPAWVEALEAAAATFEHTSPDDVSAASVTCRLGESAGEVERLVSLVSRLADQFCLDARVRMREGGFTVRLTRADAPEPR